MRKLLRLISTLFLFLVLSGLCYSQSEHQTHYDELKILLQKLSSELSLKTSNDNYLLNLIDSRSHSYFKDSTFIDSIFRHQNYLKQRQISSSTGIDFSGSYFYRLGTFSMDFETDDYAPYQQKLQGTLSWNFFNSPFYNKKKKFSLLDKEMQLSINQSVDKYRQIDWNILRDSISSYFNSAYLGLYEKQRQTIISIISSISEISYSDNNVQFDDYQQQIRYLQSLISYYRSITDKAIDIQGISDKYLRLNHEKLLKCAIKNNPDLNNINLEKSIISSRKELESFTNKLDVSPYVRGQYYIRNISHNSANMDAGISIRVPLDFDSKYKKLEYDAQTELLCVDYDLSLAVVDNKMRDFLSLEENLFADYLSKIQSISEIHRSIEFDFLSFNNGYFVLKDLSNKLLKYCDYYSYLIEIYEIMERHYLLMANAAQYAGARSISEIADSFSSESLLLKTPSSTVFSLIIDEFLDYQLNVSSFANSLKYSNIEVCFTLRDNVVDTTYQNFLSVANSLSLSHSSIIPSTVLSDKSTQEILSFLQRFDYMSPSTIYLRIDTVDNNYNYNLMISTLLNWCSLYNINNGLVISENNYNTLLNSLSTETKRRISPIQNDVNQSVVYQCDLSNSTSIHKNIFCNDPKNIRDFYSQEINLNEKNVVMMSDNYFLLHLRLFGSTIDSYKDSDVDRYKCVLRGYFTLESAKNDCHYFEQLFGKKSIVKKVDNNVYLVEIKDFYSQSEIFNLICEVTKQSQCFTSKALYLYK